MNKVVIGAIVGGLLLFLWGFVAHAVLGLSESSIRQLPDESAVVETLRSQGAQAGIYAIPGLADTRELSSEQRERVEEEWTARYRTGPTAVLIYHPSGREPMEPRQLAIELASNVLCALIASFLLAKAGPGFSRYGERVLFVTLLGLCAWLSIDVSYWNWDRFPSGFIAGELIEQVVGFALAGLAVAAIVKPQRT